MKENEIVEFLKRKTMNSKSSARSTGILTAFFQRSTASVTLLQKKKSNGKGFRNRNF